MGRPKSRDDKQLHTERVPMHMTKSEVAAVDDWRFARRIGSRSEAIRQLVSLGLNHSADEGAP
ncbi:hypothetical protein P9A16_32520 [Shinella sp. 838]|uniref:hypothetical protein n=1 Tax=Shinella sp. 838 TaxID=3038164 RepID=UPI002415721E|nr:hypothetical protein [Shinella sp. 838]MDG4675828.1 hypothetical protein [Shinella sp. 838]